MKMRHTAWLVAVSAIVTAGLLGAAWGQAGGAQEEATGTETKTALSGGRGTDLLFGPYVNAVSAEGGSVHWVAPAGVTGTCAVEGQASAVVKVVTATIPKRTEVRHTAVITGLKPGARHRYVVNSGQVKAAGTFRTAPAAGTAARFSFVVTGDTQSHPDRIGMVQNAIVKETPEFVLHTGDLTDDGQDWKLWEQECFGPGRELFRMTPVWPARGNHEKGPEPFGTLFNLPAERLWYSFDYGNLHVVVLDQWNMKSDGPMEADRRTQMTTWLEKDLAAAQGKAEWILVAGHQPMLNVAGHGSIWGQEWVVPILYKYGVDMVVSGHSHLYERFVPVAPPGAKPIQFLVAGGGGGTTYPASASPILVKAYAGLHYCVYTVDGARLEWKVKTPDGTLIDDVVLTHTKGALPAAVMEAAIPPKDALTLLKTFKNLAADVAALPQPGQTLNLSFPAGRLPVGSKVRMVGDAGSEWKVEEAKFEVKERETAVVKALPPAGVLLDEGLAFSPKLTVGVELEYNGRKWDNPSVPVYLADASLRRIMPAAEVIDVPMAAKPMTIDGDLGEWKDVPFVRLPSTKAASGRVKMAWSKEGLYGAVTMTEAQLRGDAEMPWNGDGLELRVESDARQRTSMRPRGVALKLFLWPDAEKGEVGTRRATGYLSRGGLKAAWKKTPTGYTMEFALSAKALTPATEKDGVVQEVPEVPLAAGRSLGLDWILRRDGAEVERFAEAKAYRATGGTPAYWGQVRLK